MPFLHKHETKNIVLLTLLVLSSILPFVNKPFNVDDPFYLMMAEQIKTDPYHPYSFSINWSGESRDVWEKVEATFPPLIPFFIAAAGGVFGESEAVLHLLFLIFPVAAVIAFYFLAKKFTEHPFYAAAVFAAAPAFLVSSTAIMLDIPLLAFMLSALTLFIYGSDSDNRVLLVLSGLLGGCAVMTKYVGLLIVPLMCLYIYKNGRIKHLKFAAIPLIIFGLWCYNNYVNYKGVHFVRSFLHVGKKFSTHKLIASLAFFSASLGFPFFSVLFLDKKPKLYGLALLSVLTILFALLLGFGWLPLAMALCITASLIFIYAAFRNGINSGAFIIIWFLLSLAAIFSLEPWSAARYMLVILPPAVIIFASRIKRFSVMFYAVPALLIILSGALNIADYVWASSYRDIPRRLMEAGYSKGYFAGHFGFHYYMEKAGFKALENDSVLEKGDYVVIAKTADPQKPSENILERLELKEVIKSESGFPLRVMNFGARAGFYSSFWGILPYSFSNSPVEEFAVYSVKNAE